MRTIEIRGSLLARNTMLNFMGQFVPLLVGVLTIPYVVRGLGTERFGLLSLAWVVLGYFTLFDLGLGRATTKYVAEAFGKCEEDEVAPLVWSAVAIQAALGVLGALVLAGITPLLVERIFNISQELVGEAKATFYLVAFSIPVALVSGSFSGVLEAAQRFDLVNAVKIPTGSLIFLLPVIGLLLDLSLPGIVALILLARFGASATFLGINLRFTPGLRRVSVSSVFFLRLLSFGGWVAVSSILSPVLKYLERFMIASVLSMAAVAYYTVPYDAVTRLIIIPSSFTMTLFPAFSALQTTKDRQRQSVLFARSVKYSLLLVGPITLVIWLFAGEILQLWLGVDFATRSMAILKILALGLLVNSLARTPFAFFGGIGRPDIPAKFHLVELPVYVGIVWFLVNKWGIVGAALAWSLRVTLDALLLFVAAFKLYRFPPLLLVPNHRTLAPIGMLLLVTASFGLKALTCTFPLLLQSLLVLIMLALFAPIAWRGILDDSERRMVLDLLKPWKKSREIAP